MTTFMEANPFHDEGRQVEPQAVRGLLTIEPLNVVLARVRAKPPRQYLLRRIWAQGSYGFLSAEDKAGKTWADLDLAVSVATGTPWMGHWPVDLPGPVVLFLGEGGEDKVVRRLEAICTAKGISADDIADKVHLCFRTPNLNDQGHLAQISNYIDAVSPVLVVVDPFYLAAGGATSSDLMAMGQVLQRIQHVCEPKGVALVLTHHWNKTGVGDGHNRSSGVGPGAWGRTNISMSQDASTTADDGRTTVTLGLKFQGDEVAEPDTSIVREVWTDDPNDLNSPMHYAVRPLTAGSAEDLLRCRLLDAVRAEPGIGTTALCKAVGGKTQVANQLLGLMVQTGQIVRFPHGKAYKHFLPSMDQFPNAEPTGTKA